MVCAVCLSIFVCVPFINSFIECYFIIMVETIIEIVMAILFILNYKFSFFVTTVNL